MADKTAAAEPGAPAGETKLDTQMVLFEGHRVSEHRLNFGGNIRVLDSQLVKELSLGARDVECVISGRVVARGHKVVTDKEGNVVDTVSSSTIIVESISLRGE